MRQRSAASKRHRPTSSSLRRGRSSSSVRSLPPYIPTEFSPIELEIDGSISRSRRPCRASIRSATKDS